MPLQKPISVNISTSNFVLCSMRCASTNLPWLTKSLTLSTNSGNSNIVQVEVHDEDGDQMMGKEFRYVHSGNLSKDISAYLKVIKTVILKAKLK